MEAMAKVIQLPIQTAIRKKRALKKKETEFLTKEEAEAMLRIPSGEALTGDLGYIKS